MFAIQWVVSHKHCSKILSIHLTSNKWHCEYLSPFFRLDFAAVAIERSPSSPFVRWLGALWNSNKKSSHLNILHHVIPSMKLRERSLECGMNFQQLKHECEVISRFSSSPSTFMQNIWLLLIDGGASERAREALIHCISERRESWRQGKVNIIRNNNLSCFRRFLAAAAAVHTTTTSSEAFKDFSHELVFAHHRHCWSTYTRGECRINFFFSWNWEWTSVIIWKQWNNSR